VEYTAPQIQNVISNHTTSNDIITLKLISKDFPVSKESKLLFLHKHLKPDSNTIEIYANGKAPDTPGQYHNFWRLFSKKTSSYFGTPLMISLHVLDDKNENNFGYIINEQRNIESRNDGKTELERLRLLFGKDDVLDKIGPHTAYPQNTRFKGNRNRFRGRGRDRRGRRNNHFN
jgi:hypothetical protein